LASARLAVALSGRRGVFPSARAAQGMEELPEAPAYLADTGLDANGSVRVYYDAQEGASEEYALKSIAWRLLEKAGVGVAAYNAPKNLNALTPNQVMETYLVLEHARRDPRVKALVWTGTGTRAFNAGAALKGDMKIHVPREVMKAYAKRGLAPVAGDWVQAPLTKAFWDFPKPLVMAINGLAIGGGMNIALANCGDMVVCSSKARFTYPFAKLGVTPEFGSSMMLPLLVGMPKAKELVMTGDWITADEALKFGLANAVCAPEELLPRAIGLAAKTAQFNNEGMQCIKEVMNAPLRGRLEEVLKKEQEVIMRSIKVTGGFAKNSKL